MFTIKTLNAISPVGLAKLNKNLFDVAVDADAPDGILVRSADLLNTTFHDNLLAIARAGAGVNNIPLDRCSEQGIVVQGLSNCLVKFSKCCTPVPGDKIVGFITRGYGISVHRADCPNADPTRRPPEEVGRWIKVSWGGKTRESYRTNLQVVSKDRPNLLVDISTILSAAKVHVSSLNARSTADGFALISLAVDVSDSQQLQAVMRRLEQISGVMRVTRPAG